MAQHRSRSSYPGRGGQAFKTRYRLSRRRRRRLAAVRRSRRSATGRAQGDADASPRARTPNPRRKTHLRPESPHVGVYVRAGVRVVAGRTGRVSVGFRPASRSSSRRVVAPRFRRSCETNTHTPGHSSPAGPWRFRGEKYRGKTLTALPEPIAQISVPVKWVESWKGGVSQSLALCRRPVSGPPFGRRVPGTDFRAKQSMTFVNGGR